jgi:hypothetical protein
VSATLQETREAVEQLEQHDALYGLGVTGQQNLDSAKKALADLQKQEITDDRAAKQALAHALSVHEVDFAATYAALKVFIDAKVHLEDARRAANLAEAHARRRGVLTGTHGDAERKFFDSHEWRDFHGLVKETIGASIL